MVGFQALKIRSKVGINYFIKEDKNYCIENDNMDSKIDLERLKTAILGISVSIIFD